MERIGYIDEESFLRMSVAEAKRSGRIPLGRKKIEDLLEGHCKTGDSLTANSLCGYKRPKIDKSHGAHTELRGAYLLPEGIAVTVNSVKKVFSNEISYTLDFYGPNQDNLLSTLSIRYELPVKSPFNETEMLNQRVGLEADIMQSEKIRN